MREAEDVHALAAARAGDQAAFAGLVEPYRRELLVHSYRMLGSFEDAEDILQEALLRAWRRLASFEERASLRAWLYKIATHAALDALDSRRTRSLPTSTHRPGDPAAPLPAPSVEQLWLDPLPDALLPAGTAGPEALYDLRESVTLAFLAALQHLPGRQRAVLILRDVLAWRADEVAELLEMSVAAVNSALQRARATMKTLHGTVTREAPVAAADARTARLLTRYVHAWEAADVHRLVALLREDAVLTMPPLPAWYRGRGAIQAFLLGHLFQGDAIGRFRLVATRANGSPAFAAYTRGADGVYRPGAIQVLTLAGDGIAEIHDFLALDGRLFTRFDLALAG
ncbi:MAG TPA: RNA polymerase subunit sigma-70 [Chloroflexota bacterium]|nr:RNA polymerase subunit sigma-70 [Chloroflexota bacterium]